MAKKRKVSSEDDDNEENIEKETVEPKEQDDDEDVSTPAEKSEEGGGAKRKRKRKRKKKKQPEEGEEAKDGDENGEEGVEQDPRATSVDSTVYVEGIPFDASPNDVREFFESNGNITDIVELRLPTWQDSGRLRGYGHVLFTSKESYDKALTLSGKHMGKRYLTIQPSQAPKGSHGNDGHNSNVLQQPPPENCKTLFVNNLPYAATEDEIEQAFAKYGSVENVRIARNSQNRQSKGFAYVDFETPKDLQKVVKKFAKRRIVVGGRPVRIDYDTGRVKGSFRTEAGRLWTKESKDQRRE